MSGKNLDQPWHFLPWDGYTRSGWFEWSIQLLAVFSSLVHWINLILHILIRLNGLNNLALISLMLDYSKITKMHFWMIQRAKIEFFGPFLEFGLLDRLDIAYCAMKMSRTWRCQKVWMSRSQEVLKSRSDRQVTVWQVTDRESKLLLRGNGRWH